MKEAIEYILKAVLTTVIPVIATFLCKLIAQKTNESKQQANKITIQYVIQTVQDAVKYTNQVMVNELKVKGIFDEVKQKEAFMKTYNLILDAMSDKAKECIQETFGDFEQWITVKIESAVKQSKEKIEGLFTA